jgi:hypothetical protein
LTKALETGVHIKKGCLSAVLTAIGRPATVRSPGSEVEREYELWRQNREEKLREFTQRKRQRTRFDLRYATSATHDDQRWELCERVLARTDVAKRLSLGWGEREKNEDRAPMGA